ncbi:hypothetical protein [Anoxybacteroides rupiense]|uniref:hypothetical protein n=1 Tax=Anoxybacteroides rupiense TaxID=311460 RepID=UPI003FA59A6C
MRPYNIEVQINKNLFKARHLDAIYKQLKTKSFQLENKGNASIQQLLNHEAWVRLFAVLEPLISRQVGKIKAHQELLSNVLNLPLKSDMANIAQLVVDTQEKIDALEEQLWPLSDVRQQTILNEKINKIEAELGDIREMLAKVVHSLNEGKDMKNGAE